jgi:hypothetical protein
MTSAATPTPINAKNIIALALLADGFGLEHFTIWTPDAWKAPKGFPRRELMCKPTQGGTTWRVKTKRYLKFVGYRLA